MRAAVPNSGKRRLAVLLYDRAEGWDSFPPELRTELSALGWIEGSNLSVEWRYASGDPARVRSDVVELVASAPDAILTRGTPTTRALQQATKTIPILTGVGDPVGAGFANTLARPGGNITGISWATSEECQKQVEVLRLVAPDLAQLLIVASSDRAPFLVDLARYVELPARAMGLVTSTALVSNLADLKLAFRNDRRRGEVGAVIFGLGTAVDPSELARAAMATGVPTMFEYRFYVEAGGLASYRLNWENQTRRTAAQLDKVFRGESPALIPFELPTRSELVLNRTTARALGLAIPQSLSLRADAVVD